jgi:hypothetical protein
MPSQACHAAALLGLTVFSLEFCGLRMQSRLPQLWHSPILACDTKTLRGR